MNKTKICIGLVFLSFILVSNCTGTNARSSLYGIASTTHPIQKYEQPYAGSAFRGGIFYYNDVVGGSLDPDVKSTKVSTGCSSAYLLLISLGDSSIGTIKESASISKISSVKHNISAILGGLIWHQHCTIITGE